MRTCRSSAFGCAGATADPTGPPPRNAVNSGRRVPCASTCSRPVQSADSYAGTACSRSGSISATLPRLVVSCEIVTTTSCPVCRQ